MSGSNLSVVILGIAAVIGAVSFVKSTSNGFEANTTTTANFDPDDVTYTDDTANSGLCFGQYGYQRPGQLIGDSSLGAFVVPCDSLNKEILQEQGRWSVNPLMPERYQPQSVSGVNSFSAVSGPELEEITYIGDELGIDGCDDPAFELSPEDFLVIANYINDQLSQTPQIHATPLQMQNNGIMNMAFAICASEGEEITLNQESSYQSGEIILDVPGTVGAEDLGEAMWSHYQRTLENF